jgi:hypothetical protein
VASILRLPLACLAVGLLSCAPLGEDIRELASAARAPATWPVPRQTVALSQCLCEFGKGDWQSGLQTYHDRRNAHRGISPWWAVVAGRQSGRAKYVVEEVYKGLGHNGGGRLSGVYDPKLAAAAILRYLGCPGGVSVLLTSGGQRASAGRIVSRCNCLRARGPVEGTWRHRPHQVVVLIIRS